jgi:hypothetical protein
VTVAEFVGPTGLILTIFGIAQRIGGWENKIIGRSIGLTASALLVTWGFLSLPLLVALAGAALVWTVCLWFIFGWIRGSQAEETTGQQPLVQSVGWLDRLADQDDRNMRALFHFAGDPFSIHTKNLELHDSESSSMSLAISVINASVFDLTAENIDGRITWGADYEFNREIELTGPGRVIQHGQRIDVEIRQPITQAEARRIIKGPADRVFFDTRNLRLRLSYTDRHGVAKDFISATIPSSGDSWPVPR